MLRSQLADVMQVTKLLVKQNIVLIAGALQISAGSIDLELPKNQGLDLDLSASRIKTVALSNFRGKIEDDEIKGKLNNGGIPITIRTSGTIHFSQK